LLAALAMHTNELEIGTGVLDMRYENPLYLAEEAAQTDLLSDGRLQLGIGRGSPESVISGYRSFGHVPAAGQTDTDMARQHTKTFLRAIHGEPMAEGDPNGGVFGGVPVQPQSDGLRRRVWWGSATMSSTQWAARMGLNLMSSTLLQEEKGIPFDELQAEQIGVFRKTWQEAGWDWTPRVSVTRTILPIVDDTTSRLFGPRAGQENSEQVGVLEGLTSRFGRSFIGEPETIAADLAADHAVQSADTVMVTIPNQLGVDFNLRLLESIVAIAVASSW
jgi:alkanesulfonate monooxygenase SsuD/methylene tetrahydromethanopterin reductase-like flavin-dependent oxidoreductase (luciferase family)